MGVTPPPPDGHGIHRLPSPALQFLHRGQPHPTGAPHTNQNYLDVRLRCPAAVRSRRSNW